MNRPLVAAVGAYATGLLLADWFHPPLAWLLLILVLVLVLVLISSRKPKSGISLPPARPANEPRSSRHEEAPSENQEAQLEPPHVGCYSSEVQVAHTHSGRTRIGLRRLFLWALLALAGWLNFAARTAVRSPVDLRVLLGQEPAVATVRGTLAETPRLKILQRDEQEKWRSVARVSVHSLRRNHDFEPAAGEVLVSTPNVLGPAFFSGQSVEISGVIARPPPPLAEGLFDFRDYLATRGIYY